MPTTPSPNTPEGEITHYILLILVCIFGYIGRAISKKLLQCISNTCCTGYCNTSVSEFTDSLVVGSSEGQSGVTLSAVEGRSLTWSEASERLGHNYNAACSISFLRLLFFHWSQPIGYGIALYIYWTNISRLQLLLGCVVAFREGIYVVLTLVALCRNPAYLLVDSSATFKSSGWNLLLYIVCPEKFVYFCLGLETNIPLFLLILCDFSAIAALVVAVYTNNMPVPLMIGYAVTALGGIVALLLLIGLPLLSCCGCYTTSIHLKMISIVNGTGGRHTKLDLSGASSEELIDITGLLGALARNKTLETLNLKHLELFVHSTSAASAVENVAQERAVHLLAESLRVNTTLLELTMDWTLLGTNALKMLYSTNHPSLPTNLTLRGLSLDTADAFRLSNLLRTSTVLQVLDLACNDIGNEGAAAIAAALETMVGGGGGGGGGSGGSRLKGLDLTNNNIGDVGAVALAASLQVNQTLLWLFCYENEHISNTSIALLLNAGMAKGSEGTDTVVGVRNRNRVGSGHNGHNGHNGRNGRSRISSEEHHPQLLDQIHQQVQTKRRQTYMHHRLSTFAADDSRRTNQEEEAAAEKKNGSTHGRGATPSTPHPTHTTHLLDPALLDHPQHSRHFSTMELTWEIQVEQLMALCNGTPNEMKLMFERNFVFTKVNVFGAAKYRKLKQRARRLLHHFQTILGHRNGLTKKQQRQRQRKMKLKKTSSAIQLILLGEQEEQKKHQFVQLLKRMIDGTHRHAAALPSQHVPDRMLVTMKSSHALLGGGGGGGGRKNANGKNYGGTRSAV